MCARANISAHLSRKERVVFELRNIYRHLSGPMFLTRLQQHRLSVQLPVTVAAHLAQHRYGVLQETKPS